MFYLIGIGLSDPSDITLKGLNILKKCKRVYLEYYTSILTVPKEELEAVYEKTVYLADRDLVEQQADELLDGSKEEDVALLVVGDPFGATTHTDLILRAVDKNVPYKVVHNASIMNAVGCCGLQLYNYGETVSVVFWTDSWKPESFFDRIEFNKRSGMHTLCLLDIKVKERSVENMMRDRKIYEPPRFMSAALAAQQLLEIVQNREKDGVETVVTNNTIAVGLARVGSDSQCIRTGTLESMAACDLGKPLHSLVIAGTLHPLEVEMLKTFIVDDRVLEHLTLSLST